MFDVLRVLTCVVLYVVSCFFITFCFTKCIAFTDVVRCSSDNIYE